MNQKPTIHEFGTAPQVVPMGYRLAAEVQGTDDAVREMFGTAEGVVLVRGAGVHGREGVHSVGVFVPGEEAAEESSTWYVDGQAVAAAVCRKLVAAGASFLCEPAGTEEWVRFTVKGEHGRTVRPPIAMDKPIWSGR